MNPDELSPETMPIGGNVTEERYRHDIAKGGLDWTISAERKNQPSSNAAALGTDSGFDPVLPDGSGHSKQEAFYRWVLNFSACSPQGQIIAKGYGGIYVAETKNHGKRQVDSGHAPKKCLAEDFHLASIDYG